MDVLSGGSLLQPIIVKWNVDDHTLRKGGNLWLKDWLLAQSRIFGHFWQVLVGQRESVSTPWFVVIALENFHEPLATAGISANGIDGQGSSFGDDAGVDQRTGQANESSWVASGVCDALALAECFTLFLAQFCMD